MTDVPMPSGDDAIQRGSGKRWDEWHAILDAWGAAAKSHAEIVRYVAETYDVADWWAHGVTVGYERMIGRRAVGERADGSHSASASKTVHATINDLIRAWAEETLRNQWLRPGTLALRSVKAPTSLRFDDLEAGGIVALWFTDKGAGKSAVSVQLDRLPGKAEADERKAVWKARLADLAAWLRERGA